MRGEIEQLQHKHTLPCHLSFGFVSEYPIYRLMNAGIFWMSFFFLVDFIYFVSFIRHTFYSCLRILKKIFQVENIVDCLPAQTTLSLF